MAKQNPLALGLEKLSKPASSASTTRQDASSDKPAAARTPARRGQVLIGGFFSPEVHKQLRLIAAERETTQQALLADALNILFARDGKPEIATLGRILDAPK